MPKLAINGGKKIRNKFFPMQKTIGEEEKQAILKVLDKKILSGYRGNATESFWGGEMVQELENKFCEKFKVKYALAVNSCTSALQLACGAIGIKQGDEVIVTPWSMSCSASAPMIYGGVPVFCDIEKDYFCLDAKELKKKITEKTKAIIVVDLFGQPYNFQEINKIAKEYNLFIIEDAAQAIGSYYVTQDYGFKYCGSFGDIGCFSFTQGKHLTAGEGGMLVTDNYELYSKLAMLRNHAEAVCNDADIFSKSCFNYPNLVGFNMRMTEIQAAILVCQLDKLDDYIQYRRRNVFLFKKNISRKIPFIDVYPVRESCTHSYYVLPFKYDISYNKGIHRDDFIESVKAELNYEENRIDRGIPISCGYIKPLNRFPLFNNKKGIDYLPIVNNLYESELFLTLYHGLPLDNQDRIDIINAFEKVYNNMDELRSNKRR